MPSYSDAFEVFEEGDFDRIMDGEEDTEFFEMDIDESIQCDPNEVHYDMWSDFDQINQDDLPDGFSI